jgi:hypothetical protein
MCHHIYRRRPTCVELLSEYNRWGITGDDMKESFNFTENLNEVENSDKTFFNNYLTAKLNLPEIWSDEQEEQIFAKKNLKVYEKLGWGTFGQVFKVKHQVDNQLYAVKCISLPGNFEVCLFKITLN